MKKNTQKTLKLKVTEALSKDAGRAFARIGPEDMEKLGVATGDIVEVDGARKTVCKVMPAYMELRNLSRIQLDGISRDNASVSLDEPVVVRKTTFGFAEKVTLSPINLAPAPRDMKYIGSLLDGLPVVKGDRIRATLFGSRPADFRVDRTIPSGPALINPTTLLEIGQGKEEETSRSVTYEDIGGLKPQLRRIREMIEMPLRYPEVFKRLGIDPPTGVLLHGPPGCGKTLIARSIARETDANFFAVNGPEVIHKFYGESEAHLRKIFDDAGKKGPSIVFIDEIDAIAPKREKVVGDVEKRVVAQLLALMDGLNRRQNIIVIAATNIPNALDPALRRPGRFDREITIPVPDRNARQEILEIYSRGMPLTEDVDLVHLADITHGFVGADLEALCREAAMLCLRRIMPGIDFDLNSIPYEQLSRLEVFMEDFLGAFKEVEPSAVREVFVEVPDVRWKDIGGLGNVKDLLVEAVEWPLKYASLFKKAGVSPSKGVLLSGPPGSGKTLMAKAAANESGVNFISVKGPALFSRYVGESESALREIFQKARQAAPCIIFFDEIDSMLPSRMSGGSDDRVAERVLSQFLAEMDGVEELKSVLVMAATNRADMLDPAVLRPGRFDHIVEVSLPDRQGRLEILNIHLRNRPMSPEVDIEDLASVTSGFSGADIAFICNRAALSAVRRHIHAQQEDPGALLVIRAGDMELALEECRNRKT